MLRPALAAALLLGAPAALAQSVTRPTVTVSAGVMRTVSETVSSSPGGTSVGYLGQTFYAASIGGEVPVYDLHGLLTASVGGSVRAASGLFGGDFALQSACLYTRVGTDRVSGLLGVAADVGNGIFESGNTSGINSDGQTAILAQLSGSVPAGPGRVFGQIDGAFALPTRDAILVTTSPDPDGIAGQPYPVQVRTGHQGSARLGAAVPVGPVEVALAVVVAGRTEGSYRFADALPPPIETSSGPLTFSRDNPFQFGYSSTIGLIPSVTYRTPDERLTLRIDGSFTGYSNMEDTPLGFSLASEDGPETRPAVTISASFGL